MKKLVILAAITMALSSCGAICGGKVTDCQKHKPSTGTREIRPAALVGDIFLFPVISLTVDFCTGAMYKPCTNATTGAHH